VEVKAWLNKNPSGLGYIRKSSVDDSVRVIYLIEWNQQIKSSPGPHYQAPSLIAKPLSSFPRRRESIDLKTINADRRQYYLEARIKILSMLPIVILDSQWIPAFAGMTVGRREWRRGRGKWRRKMAQGNGGGTRTKYWRGAFFYRFLWDTSFIHLKITRSHWFSTPPCYT